MAKKQKNQLYRYSDANTHTDNLTLSEAQSFQRKQNGGSIMPMKEKTLHERLNTPGTWPFAEDAGSPNALVGTVEFRGIQCLLTRVNFEMIADALAILSPDSDAGCVQAQKLESVFRALAEAK